MRVLVACEFSGIVRDAFIARGHEALSVDLLPTERPGPHRRTDIRKVLREGGEWDLMIAHPPCTYLANSGVQHLYSEKGRIAKMRESVGFFQELLAVFPGIPRVAVENPIMHRYGRAFIGSATQKVQPWMFGHPEQKATCLWLRGLPPLVPTQIVSELQIVDGRVIDGRRQTLHKLSPSPVRWMERSRTFQGLADAMASQWGAL